MQVGAEALFDAGELLRINLPIHLAPANFAFAGGLTHEELIVRQTPGILPGAHNERPEMTEHALVAADGLLVERGRGQVPIDIAEVFEAEMRKALGFLKRCSVHVMYIEEIIKQSCGRIPGSHGPVR